MLYCNLKIKSEKKNLLKAWLFECVSYFPRFNINIAISGSRFEGFRYNVTTGSTVVSYVGGRCVFGVTFKVEIHVGVRCSECESRPPLSPVSRALQNSKHLCFPKRLPFYAALTSSRTHSANSMTSFQCDLIAIALWWRHMEAAYNAAVWGRFNAVVALNNRHLYTKRKR